jgi:DNA invertase Pin-like site-specific DNA recombinase
MAVYAYRRGSTNKQVMTPEVQRQAIAEYAASNRLVVDGEFTDTAVSGAKRVFVREAGKQLNLALRPGDHVIVAKIDRLSRSLIDFCSVLQTWQKRQITLHICDFPGGKLDPGSPIMALMLHILVCFAEFERKMISTRTAEGLAIAKKKGHRTGRFPEYGYRFVQRWDHSRGRSFQVAVPDHVERGRMVHLLQLRLQGYTPGQIREKFNHEFNYRTREGRRWNPEGIRRLTKLAVRNLADNTLDLGLPRKEANGA